jgi:hypothetical protein
MGVDRQLAVSPVVTPREWRSFFGLTDRIYRNDPAFVRPLNSRRNAALDFARNPFYQHAQAQAFLCREGDEVVGRIVAIVDRLHQEYYRDRLGCFGFYESIDDRAVAGRLLDAAQAWLAEQGCDAMRGPLNPSMKGDFGVLVEGNHCPPNVMMAHTPRYYHDLLLANRLEVIRTFHAYALHASDDRQAYARGWAEYESLCQRIRERFPHIKIRPARRGAISAEIHRINDLGDQVRRVGWGFVPFTPAELEYAVAQLQRVLNPDFVYLAEVGDRLIGYLMMLPDVNWALQRTIGKWDWIRLPQLLFWLPRIRRVRIFGVGVLPEYRHSGLAGLLIKRLYDDWGEKYRAWEFSWVDSKNFRSIRSIQGFVPLESYKTYHLYERTIPTGHSPPVN